MTYRFKRAIMVTLCIVMVVGSLVVPQQSAQADVGANWTGSYFNNPSLQGSPVFTRIDPAVVFNWGPYSPGTGIGSQYWSARWESIQYLNAGVYRFTITSDDGVRVFIDGTMILDAWRDQAPTTYNVNVQVISGAHAIRVEYYQALGDASLAVSWAPVVTQSTSWVGQYYNNPDLIGPPVLTRYETGIDYYWGLGSPDPRVAPDNFSARWTITIPFRAGTYRFTLAGDDGVRLLIDDISVINQWRDQSIQAYSIDVPLAEGLHTIRVEYYDRVGTSAVRLRYELAIGPPPYPGTNSTQWYGEYFTNPSLAGIPTFTRFDGTSGLRFNWSTAAPAPAFPRENFSVRWTRQVCVPGRPYVFYLTADDGVRFFIDTTLIIDAWRVQDRTTYRQNVDLTAGCHTFRVEYFQAQGNALMDLTWEPPDGQVPPQYVGGQPVPPPPVPGGNAITAVVEYAYLLNVRSGPSISYGVLTQILRGTPLVLSARNADSSWVRVTTPTNLSGWVNRSYLRIVNGNYTALPVAGDTGPVQPPTTTGVRGRTTTGLRLRVGPGTNFAQLGTLGYGTALDIVGRNANNTWLQVRYGSLLGWVYAPYIQIFAGSLANVPITG